MKRIPRVNQLLKKEVSQLLLREVEFAQDILVTVTRVETSTDLRDAAVYISVLPENKSPDVIVILKRRLYDVQKKINQKLQMRPVPKIKFIEEKKTKEAGEIEKLLLEARI